MSYKEVLIRGYLFNAGYAYLWFQFDDLIDQQKRITMGQNLLNLDVVVNTHDERPIIG